MFAIADAYIEKAAAINPLSATNWGIDAYNDQLGDFSPARYEAEEDLARGTLAELNEVIAAADVDRIGRALMAERLECVLALCESGEIRRTFSVLLSPPSDIRQVFELQPATTPEHAEQIRARLAAVRQALRSWQTTLEQDLARNFVSARRQALGVAAQLETYAEGAFAEVGDRLGAACGVCPESSGLRAAGDDADRACGELAEWLRARYVPGTLEADAVGRDRYMLWSRTFLGADIDLTATYEWGWEDLKQIAARMHEVARKVAPGTQSLVEAASLLDADESRALHGTEALLSRLVGLTEGAIGMLAGRHFEIDPRIVTCEARLAPEGSQASPYYIPPSEDLSRPGTTWYPTLGHDRFPLWRDVSTWYHESVPGHHLQIATSILERERQSRFQRLEGFVSSYGEGWALYAERLMDELGAYSDLGDELGYLASQALRAARVVVDIGMHLGLRAPGDIGALGPLAGAAGRVWDAGMALALLEGVALLPGDTATSEVDRYLGLPAQAISYKVGERTWLACREDARRRLGSAFDLKSWHSYALAIGPMGLGPFREEMARFGQA